MAYGAILNQKPQKKMLPEIIITPLDDSISFVHIVSPTGEQWEVFPNSQGLYIGQLKVFGTYQVVISTTPLEPETVFEVNVDTCKQYNYVFPSPSTTLNDNSWAVIRYASDNNLGESLWSVGDRKEIIIDGQIDDGLTLNNYSTYVFILGFNHNETLEGQGITFGGFKSALSGGKDICLIDNDYLSSKTSGSWFNMNNSQSNSGGWNKSRMRTVICPAFMNAMPSDLRNVLKTVTKYSDNTGGGSNTASYVTSTTDTIFLLAEFEVFGTRSYANSAERNYQAQYAYYSAGNSKVKYRHSATGSTARWWLRSVDAGGSRNFCFVIASGSTGADYAYYSQGFAPAFVV